jgi:Na+-transporting NADH:ubiquinone oxidoreductase subunit B
LSFVLGYAGISSVPGPLASMLSGSFLFGAFFVVTEPITGPKTEVAQWIYGFLIGGMTIVLRRYSNFSEGIMFAVLFMNMFVPVMDMAVRDWRSYGEKV